MKIESLKEVFLTKAKDTFLFDCRVANVDPQTMSAFHDVLTSFIRFTGDILVRELTPDHVRIYIDNLSDGPSEGEEHTRTVMSHYAVIESGSGGSVPRSSSPSEAVLPSSLLVWPISFHYLCQRGAWHTAASKSNLTINIT
jgi:hypothetical protein